MYLLDTNVISDIRKPRPHGAVVSWLNSVSTEHLKISAMTVGEIGAGIEVTRDQDPAKAEEIEAWLAIMLTRFEVLAMDAAVMRVWARLMHNTSDDLYEDAIIAATAKVHGLIVATRNTRDFKDFGVGVVDPFAHR